MIFLMDIHAKLYTVQQIVTLHCLRYMMCIPKTYKSGYFSCLLWGQFSLTPKRDYDNTLAIDQIMSFL